MFSSRHVYYYPSSGPSGWLRNMASRTSMGRRTCPRSLLTFWTDVLRSLLIIIWSKYYTSGECWRSMDSRTVEGSPVSSDVSTKERDPTTYSENKRAKREEIAFAWQYLSIAWKWQGKTGWKNFILVFKSCRCRLKNFPLELVKEKKYSLVLFNECSSLFHFFEFHSPRDV